MKKKISVFVFLFFMLSGCQSLLASHRNQIQDLKIESVVISDNQCVLVSREISKKGKLVNKVIREIECERLDDQLLTCFDTNEISNLLSHIQYLYDEYYK